MAPVARQHRVELFERLRRELGELDPGVAGPVGGQHAGAAAIGDDGEAVAARALVGAEDLGRGEELAEGQRPHRTGPFQRRVEHVVGAHQRAGMGRSGLGTRGMAARFQHDHRFQPGGRPHRRQERRRIVHPLDIEQDRVGLRIGGEELHDVAEVDIGRVAQADQGREAEVMRTRPVGNRRVERARLRDQGKPALGGAGAQEGGVQLLPGAHQADAVRPHEAHARAVRLGDQLGFVFLAVAAALAEPGRQDDRVMAAGLAEVADDAGHGLGRRGDQGEVDFLTDLEHGGIALQPADLLVLGIDGMDLPLEPVGFEVGKNPAADALGVFGRAIDRDRFRVHHFRKRVGFHKYPAPFARTEPDRLGRVPFLPALGARKVKIL